MSWRGVGYFGPDYFGPDYYSSGAEASAVLAATQAPDVAGQQPYFGRNYFGVGYRGVDYWGQLTSWVAVATAGPQTLTVQPPFEIDIGPLWTFNIRAGLTGLVLAAQAPQVALLVAQATTTPNARVAQILARQADQVGALRANFLANALARVATLNMTQAPDGMVIVGTHVFSGATGAKRYGWIENP